ncbi:MULTISPECIES: sugar ABC transporter substrate-binding protein [unclassified Rhizobium]|jgi:multiple sugar transport system substrate-binding protein|uniref:ABC transporter substrate-binding protein n=1 Tax=unclassified Rhizobium TaxID=2613769 RepID=UPI000A740E51|nr:MULTISPECIES: sugar ABC transporter substrate-binding protein [unclassified Rhizobium]RKD35524.1 carbohydrate ABC transporter substrate-binding protein (CUT1 family) [Rhizobium sp. WW_1]
MMKSLLKAATLGAALLAAGSALAEQTTLQFWDNQQTESGLSDVQKAAVERFMKENPDIKIEVTTVPYPEYQQRLLTAVQGGNAPDVATLDQIWVGAFAKAGAIADLTGQASAAGISRDGFFGGAWDSAVLDSKLYGIPFNVDVWQFSYYNKALLDAAKIDPASLSTFDGLKSAAEKLTTNGKFGVGLFGHKGEDTVVVGDSFIFSNGGRILKEDGSCALTEAPAIEALTYLQGLAKSAPAGILNASSGDMRELFLNGSLAIEFWPALEQPTLQESKIDWGFVNGTAPAGKTPVGTFGGWNLAVFQSSKHQEAAWKFIQFMVRADVNGDVVDLIPANKKAAEAFLQKNRKDPQAIMTQLDNAKARPLSPRYLELADAQIAMFQDIYAGNDPKAAAAKACSVIDTLK